MVNLVSDGSVGEQRCFPALRCWPVLRVLLVGLGGTGQGAAKAGVGGGDLAGLGPGRVDLEELPSSGAYEESGDGEDAPQAFGFVTGGGAGQGEALGPGEQVGGQGGDGRPNPILGQVVEGQVAHPGVFGTSSTNSPPALP